VDGPTYEQLRAVYDAAGHNGQPHDGPWELPTPLVDWPEAYGLGEDMTQWLAEPLIPDASAVAIFAKGGTGKSLLALWLAAGLATGSGLTGAVEAVDVLYLDYEMTIRDVVERLEDMGYDDPEALSRLHYASLPSLPALNTRDGGQAVLDMAQHLKATLVVIDTFGRAVHGEENNSDTVRDWYRWTGQPLKSAGIGFVRIDHAGKDATRGQRGTSAKNDDVDIVWEMTDRGHGEFLMQTTKRRVPWVPERVVLQRTDVNGILGYRLRDGEQGLTEQGESVARLLDELGAPVDISRPKALALLRDNGAGRANNVVAEAVRHRKQAGTGPGYRANTASDGGSGTGVDTDTYPQVVHAGYTAVQADDPTGPQSTHHVVVCSGQGGPTVVPEDEGEPDPGKIW
jgi:hypothetical protein